jgi:WD40 repeat protein
MSPFPLPASDDSHLYAWDAESGAHAFTLRGHTDQVNAVAFLNTHRVVSAAEDRTIKVWDSQTGELVLTLRGHHKGVLGVSCRPDGRSIATSSADRTARIWDISKTGDQTIPLDAPRL